MDRRNNSYRNFVKKALLGDPILIFFDTETVGLKPHDQIIEFSAIVAKIEHEPFRLMQIDSCVVYIKPELPISNKIENLTGITNAFLEKYPEEKEASIQIFEFLQKYPGTMIGYNVTFDMLKMEGLYLRQRGISFERNNIDVLEMAKDCVPSAPTYKLESIAKILECIPEGTFHDAYADTQATMRIFLKCIEIYNSSYKKENNKMDCFVKYAYFWKNPKQGKMQRIICDTSLGRFFYDTVSKQWGIRQADIKEYGFDIQAIDLDSVTEQLYWKYHVESMEELTKLLREKAKKRKEELSKTERKQ